MNRRGFLGAAVAAGWALVWRRPVEAAGPSDDTTAPDHATLVRAALREHRLLEFRYHDHVRRAEPHALGRRKDGRLALLAWQVAGGSRSEPPPGWRNFLLEEIERLEMGADRFTPRPDYRPEKNHFAEIIAEVAP